MTRHRFKRLIEALEKTPDQKVLTFATVVLATATAGLFIATIALVIITSKNINVAEKMTKATEEMATQTSRMAEYTKNNTDVSIDQFKIRSYPDFLVEVLKFQLDLETRLYQFKICNMNEISAQKVSTLIVDFYKSGQQSIKFYTKFITVYKIDGKGRSIDFETNLSGDSVMILKAESAYPPEFGASDLLHSLLFIKFKVPYDEKYRYEERGYIIKREGEKETKIKYHLQEMSTFDTKSLIQNYIKNYIGSQSEWTDRWKIFFSDYELEDEET